MSNHIQNPQYKPHRQLGFSDTEWDELKALVQAVLAENEADPTVDIAMLRAVDDRLAVSAEDDEEKMTDRNWNQLAHDMGLGPELPAPHPHDDDEE